MFGPTNIDEVYVQATQIEAGKTRVGVSGEQSSRKEDKKRWNARRKIQWQERKRSPLVSIARKKGMMMTIAENCTQRRDRSGSKRQKGGKQLQQQHVQQTWDMIKVMRLKSQQLVCQVKLVMDMILDANCFT